MERNNWNPWSLKSLEDFLFYCCPECDVKNRERSIFLNHVLDMHPQAKDFICDSIKKEDEDSIVENVDLLYSFKTENNIKQTKNDETLGNEDVEKHKCSQKLCPKHAFQS